MCLALAGTALGQTPTPESLVAEGVTLEATDPAAAIAKYQAALELNPVYFPAHVRWLTSLQRLTQQASNSDERNRLVQTLSERFTAASRCTEADWRFFVQWATVEAERAGTVPATERTAVLVKMAELAGGAVVLAPAGEAQDAARLQQAALLIAKVSDLGSEDLQRQFYQQAAQSFAAVPLAKLNQAAQEAWAVALLHGGRLAGDRKQQLDAVKRFETLLAADPDNVLRQYNLACGYAVLGATTNALATLRPALANDKSGAVLRAIKHDVEWRELRDTPEFQRLLQATDPAADKFLAEGAARQMAAERTSATQQAAQHYLAALEQYEKALQLRPEFVTARWKMAVCYERLAALTEPGEARLRFLQSAHQQYAVAAAGRDVDWKLYHQWASFLMRDVATAFTVAADQRLMLEQSRSAFGEALQRVKFSADQAQIQTDLGWCLVRLAQVTTDGKRQQALNNEATQHFAAAIKVPQFANTARPYAGWGLAQLEMARSQHNRLLVRQAVERLQTAAEKDPSDADVQFHLSRAYALLRQRADALRHLRQSVALAPAGTYAKQAQASPEWEAYGADPEFQEILNVPAPSAPTIETTLPRISGR